MQHVTFASAYKQLQPVEKQFVDGYVAALEAAAERAGERISVALQRPVPPELIARAGGLLERPLVQAAIADQVREISLASELSVAKVIRHLSAVAFSSMQDYQRIGEDGKPYFDFSNVTPDQWLAVKTIEYEINARGGSQKIKLQLHDKLAGLFKYVEMFGLSEPDNSHVRQYTQQQKLASPSVPSSVGKSVEGLADYYQQLLNVSG